MCDWWHQITTVLLVSLYITSRNSCRSVEAICLCMLIPLPLSAYFIYSLFFLIRTNSLMTLPPSHTIASLWKGWGRTLSHSQSKEVLRHFSEIRLRSDYGRKRLPHLLKFTVISGGFGRDPMGCSFAFTVSVYFVPDGRRASYRIATWLFTEFFYISRGIN